MARPCTLTGQRDVVASQGLKGATIGHLEVLAPLGSGGMADVYRAEDPRLDRVVALKVIKAERARDEAAQEALRREARLAARVKDPHVATVYGAGELDGLPWYTMELLLGGSLADVIEEKSSFTLHQYLSLFAQACAGLQAAAGSGVFHRDVKPGNLLLDAHGRLKLTDFGLARLKNDEGRRTSWLLGTPNYMAPEIVEGSGGDVASDIYSLGASFFHLFAGRPPYLPTGKPFGVIEQHRFAPVADLRGVNGKAPGVLRDLLAEMMAKAPRDRPRTFRKVGDRVREIAAGFRSGKLDERVRWCPTDQAMTPESGDKCGLCKERYPRVVRSRQLFDVDIVGWVAEASIDRVAEYMAGAVGQETDAIRAQLAALPFRLGSQVPVELATRMEGTFGELGAKVESRAGAAEQDRAGARRLEVTPLWPAGELGATRRKGLLGRFV